MSNFSDIPENLNTKTYDETPKSGDKSQNIDRKSTILLATAGATCCAVPLIVAGVLSFSGLGLIAGGTALLASFYHVFKRSIGLK